MEHLRQFLEKNQTLSSDSLRNKRRVNIEKIKSTLKLIPVLQRKHNLQRKEMWGQGESEKIKGQTDKENEKKGVKQEQWEGFFEEKYEVLQKLGEGSSGVVYRCAKRSNDQTFAVKVFTFQDEHIPGLKANFLVLKRLKHPYILSYEGLYLDIKKHQGWLVMELAEAPSLAKAHICREEELKTVMHQLFQALNYLHKQDIVHRDIKPENVLYDPQVKTIKIIDFGISRRCRKRGQLFNMWSNTGTLYYKAPEMFSGSYREGVDVWAAGILLYQLVCGYTPFESQYHSQTIQNISNSELYFSPSFNFHSYQLKAIIVKMLQRNPLERPSCLALLRDSWLLSTHPISRKKLGSLRRIQSLCQDNQMDETASSDSFYQPMNGSLRFIDGCDQLQVNQALFSKGSFTPLTKQMIKDDFFFIESQSKQDVLYCSDTKYPHSSKMCPN